MQHAPHMHHIACSSWHTFRPFVCVHVLNRHAQTQPSRVDSSPQTTKLPVRPTPPLYPLPQVLCICSSLSALPFMRYSVQSPFSNESCSTQYAWPGPPPLPQKNPLVVLGVTALILAFKQPGSALLISFALTQPLSLSSVSASLASTLGLAA